MTTISNGDRVEIVMDVVHVTNDEGEFERVLVQGVYPYGEHASHPPLAPGAYRNVVGVFFGRNMGGIPAFLIPSADADRE
jgi:hypothetical protein